MHIHIYIYIYIHIHVGHIQYLIILIVAIRREIKKLLMHGYVFLGNILHIHFALPRDCYPPTLYDV